MACCFYLCMVTRATGESEITWLTFMDDRLMDIGQRSTTQSSLSSAAEVTGMGRVVHRYGNSSGTQRLFHFAVCLGCLSRHGENLDNQVRPGRRLFSFTIQLARRLHPLPGKD
ncbi:hypothetical protein LZ30DRAFT_350159 [Colletotrichum cereale]|nr:hypothetical protein LZ30DRAFT_350159 [Colletotrichum cereale]